ncbi:MAG: hypothetical protein AB1Z19_02865 [Eubacteriales bacterium]
MTEIKNGTLDQIKNDFFSLFGLSKFEFDTIICDDLQTYFFALRPDLKGRVTGDLNKFNGTIVHPKSNQGNFTLLINKDYYDKTTAKGTNEWMGTFAHEATHIVDYKAYLGLSGAADYDEIRYSGKYNMFFFWTEFHARKNGYYFWQKQTGVEYNEVRLQVIKAQEYPFQKKYLLEKYKSTDDEQKLMYYLCQFMGRLAVWEAAFPNFFDSARIKAILDKFDGPLNDFYTFFKENTHLAKAFNNFGQLKSQFLKLK